MSVATHLGIRLSEYDARIRTFIPDYEEMLDVAAAALPRSTRAIVDLGTGTGALALRCLHRAARARVVGIDADAEILKVAAKRLGDRATFIEGSFLRAAIPHCDAIVSSFALHHVRTRGAKLALYRKLRRALARRGCLLSVDCQPSGAPDIRSAQIGAWRDHLGRHYDASEARRLLRIWANEDTYVSLDREISLLDRAGFHVDVMWRKGAFAVLQAR
jgi:ubiquinone/menaquinone biosynthesis C-methylase UbiE